MCGLTHVACGAAMVDGMGTQDLCGKSGLHTEEFVDHIAERLEWHKGDQPGHVHPKPELLALPADVDVKARAAAALARAAAC